MSKVLELSPGEWAVLGLVGERPTHGFALAQVLAPGGELGSVWTMARPAVYNAVNKLGALGLIHPVSSEPGARGPMRTVVSVTQFGSEALEGWLDQPVDHVRDVRSMLLVKLALLHRSGSDPSRLIGAQEARLTEQVASLSKARDQSVGFDRVILEWRLSSSLATIEFLRSVKGVPGERHW